MNIRSRLDRSSQVVSGLPPRGQLDLAVAVPVGCGMADDLPPGVHLPADGRVATVVFEGAGPDAAVMAGLQKRLVAFALEVTSTPTPTPITHPLYESGQPSRAGQIGGRL